MRNEKGDLIFVTAFVPGTVLNPDNTNCSCLTTLGSKYYYKDTKEKRVKLLS